MAAYPDMHGKIVMVTGATDGIGKATAHALAALGATVLVVGRNPAKISATIAEIGAAGNTQQLDSFQADFSSLAQVRRLAEQVRARYDRLDVLINNAGTIFSERGETVDGFERTFAVNHLAPFLLTNLLLDLIVQSAPARIVNVSSMGHRFSGMNFDNLQAQRSYNSMNVYGQSKLANVMFTYELARRLSDKGVTVNALHPGGVATNMGHDQTGLSERVIATLLRYAGLTAANGARTSVYLAASPEVTTVTGQYFVRRKARRSSAASYDQAAQARLWQVSAELTGVSASIAAGGMTVAPTN